MDEVVTNLRFEARVAPADPHRVAVVAVDRVVLFDLGIPTQIFGHVVDADGALAYRVDVCSAGGRPVRSSAGVDIAPDHGLELLERADTVVIAGPAGDSPLLDAAPADELLDALRAASDRGARLVSICTGAFVIAAAGLLDGRRATTHWHHAERFRRRFPRVQLDADVLFVDDGDVLTSAGVAAGIDLCLHLVRTDHGSAAASTAARRSVVAPVRFGGQAQFIETPMPEVGESGIPGVLTWAMGHLDGELTIETLARRARMSPRTFSRRFSEHTGLTPLTWITEQRLSRARELLESTQLGIDQIALRSGLGSPANARALFRRRMGQSPREYRRAFGAA